MSTVVEQLSFAQVAEDVCLSLSNKHGKDSCLYTGLKVPSGEQVHLVLLKPNGTPRAVKQSCFSSAEALAGFIKELGKGMGASDSDVKQLLLINGVSKCANKDRANTMRQIAVARGKCSPFMSSEELAALEEARKAFLDAEKEKAAAVKAEKKEKKADEAVVEGAEKKKRAPKRKAEEALDAEAVICVDVAEVKEPSPKAKRVKKPKAEKKPAEILGQAPEESLSAQVAWSGMAQ